MRRVIIAGALAGLLPSAARGQEGADSLVLHHVFTAGIPGPHVILQKDVVYRAELRGQGSGLRFVAERPGAKAPFTALTGTLPDTPLSGVYQVYVADSGDYQVTLTAPRASPTTLDLLLDPRLTAEHLEKVTRPRWTIGFEMMGGAHSAYELSTGSTDSDLATVIPMSSGSDIEGALSIRDGDRAGVVIGMGRQASGTEEVNVTWFFVEPRMALRAPDREHQSTVEAGVSFRVALGSSGSDTYRDHFLLAPGAYLAKYLSRRPTGQGTSIRAAADYGFIPNSNESGSPGFFRLAVGLNWHP